MVADVSLTNHRHASYINLLILPSLQRQNSDEWLKLFLRLYWVSYRTELIRR